MKCTGVAGRAFSDGEFTCRNPVISVVRWLAVKKSDSPMRKAMTKYFDDFDLSDFWEASEYAEGEYVDSPLTAEKVEMAERTLGYKLPGAYIALMATQNGGVPKRTNHRTQVATSWAEDHVAITGILSIGASRPSSLCGAVGSRFWVEEWGYPPIGVYFADCPSAGHDMLCLDYRHCGPDGDPTVVHVDQENDYKITFVAGSFEAFIRGLQADEDFE